MKTITVEYGVESVETTLPESATVEDILNHQHLKAVLGYGSNSVCLMNGQKQPMNHAPSNGSVINIQSIPSSYA